MVGYRTIVLCLFMQLLGCSSPAVQPVTPEPHIEIKPSALTLEEHVLAKLKTRKLNNSIYASQLKTVLKGEKKKKKKRKKHKKIAADAVQSDESITEKKIYEKIIPLNILGFLSKANYSVHYSDRAIRLGRKFLRDNERTLHLAEKRYAVSKESIAALLWVETQYGAFTGKFPLAQVFLSMLMADHPIMINSLIKEAVDRRTLDPALRERFPDVLAFEQKIVDRTSLKADWALDQLAALDDLRKAGYNRILLQTGSFAGAFGVPQFLPSTYRDLAVSASSSRKPNLYKMPDVILSVGNFLKKKGWIEERPETKSIALYEYNRIKDYGDVILKIAAELKILGPAEPEPQELPKKKNHQKNA